MSSSNQENQASQGCCGSTNESFDCAAIMERFKNCCENTKPEVHILVIVNTYSG